MADKKPAVLMIDGDNVPGALADEICEAASAFGDVQSVHLFANFKNSDPNWSLATYRHAMHVHYFPVIVPKKNVTDMALAIEAMKTIYRHPEIDIVIIASNDTDYMPLAAEIRASGKEAVNLYTKRDNTQQLVAYDRSAFVEKKTKVSPQNERETPKQETGRPQDPHLALAHEVFDMTKALIDEAEGQKKAAKIPLSLLNQKLSEKDPSFDPKKSFTPCRGMKVMMKNLLGAYPALFKGYEISGDSVARK